MMQIRRANRTGACFLACAIAIAVTASMDATGLTAFSALPLFGVAALLWVVTRESRRSVGLTLGRGSDYAIALAYPLVVLGVCAAIALGGRAASIVDVDWARAARNIAIASAATIVVAVLTEEGFFRGVLWASLRNGRRSEARVLVWSTVAFALWHVSAVTLPTGFDLPVRQIPVFLLDAAVMGAIWGVLRHMSGSIVVSSVSHGVWNGITYTLFGYGTRRGALGVSNTALYGPEVGLLGLGLNALALCVFLTVLLPAIARNLRPASATLIPPAT
jgi:membrane protease YdiL (CAAX protease family)